MYLSTDGSESRLVTRPKRAETSDDPSHGQLNGLKWDSFIFNKALDSRDCISAISSRYRSKAIELTFTGMSQ